jgi:hypothetical protein
MLTKKKAMTISNESENLVYLNLIDVFQLIELHARLGMYEMEIFVEKKKSNKFASSLRKRGFYCRVLEFKALEHECKFYVSWISNF